MSILLKGLEQVEKGERFYIDFESQTMKIALKAGKFLHVPAREDIPENIKEQLIVELYSKN